MYGRIEVKNGAKFLKENGAMFELRVYGIATSRKFKDTVTVFPGIMPDLVSINFRVFLPRFLKPIKEIETLARKAVQRRELKIGFKRIHYIPKDCITDLVEDLNELESKYYEAANKNLILPYHQRVKEILNENSKLTRDMIPGKDKLERSFYFDWTFFELNPPDPGFGVLPKNLYNEIKKKYEEKMDRACMLAVVGLKEEMLDLLAHAVERLGYTKDEENKQKKKVFKKSMIEKIKQFCEDFKKRDIFKDEALDDVVSQIEQLLEGNVDDVVNLLRKEDKFRERARVEIEKVKIIVAQDIIREKEIREVFIPSEILEKAKKNSGENAQTQE